MAFHGYGTLTYSGNKITCLNFLSNKFCVSRTIHTRIGEDQSVTVSVSHLLNTCLQVSACGHDLSLRIEMVEKSNTACGRTAHNRRTLRQVESLVVADHHVVGGFTLCESDEFQVFREGRRQILGAVHGNVDCTFKKRQLNLFCEDTFASDLGDCYIQHRITAGSYRYDLRGVPRGSDKFCNMIRLPHSNLAGASTSANLPVHRLIRVSFGEVLRSPPF